MIACVIPGHVYVTIIIIIIKTDKINIDPCWRHSGAVPGDSWKIKSFFFTIFSLLYLRIQIIFLILAACCFPLRLLWTCLTLTTRICSPSPFICHFIQICSPIHQQFLCFSPWSRKQNVFGFFFLTYFYRGTVIQGLPLMVAHPALSVLSTVCAQWFFVCFFLSRLKLNQKTLHSEGYRIYFISVTSL